MRRRQKNKLVSGAERVWIVCMDGCTWVNGRTAEKKRHVGVVVSYRYAAWRRRECNALGALDARIVLHTTQQSTRYSTVYQPLHTTYYYPTHLVWWRDGFPHPAFGSSAVTGTKECNQTRWGQSVRSTCRRSWRPPKALPCGR